MSIWIDWINGADVQIGHLPELVDPEPNDELLIRDVSEDKNKKILYENLAGLPGFVITDQLNFVFNDQGGFVLTE